jgi:Zn-finger nucleic acid-binding protein
MPRCPLCRTQCDRINYEGVSIYNCGSCGGHWLSPARLDVICKRREYEMPEPVKQKMMEIADASDTAERLLCITCGKEMVKEQFKHWPEIRIDRCPKCNGIWLDRGELEKCQIYWEYAQDHPEEWENSDLVARQALLEAELQNRKADLRRQVEEAEEARRMGYYGTTSFGHPGALARILVRLFGR